MSNPATTEDRGYTSIRVILILLVLGLVTTQLVLTFRGLFHAEAMDQAQIARNIAHGDGFTTQFIRPVELVDHAKAQADRDIEQVDLANFRDTNYAPLYPYTLSLAMLITGQSNVEATQLLEVSPDVYGPDRLVAGVSTLFFLVALVLAFILTRKLFDEYLAYSVVGFMTMSNLFLDFAISGLPQMMMLCLFLAALIFFVKAHETPRHKAMKVMTYMITAFVFIALLVLTSWIAIWIALAAFVYVMVFFRPHGIYTIPGIAILLLFLMPSLLMNATATGALLGNMYYEFYNFEGGGSEMVMRLANVGNLPLNSSSFWLRLFGETFGQLSNLYTMMGSIMVVPLFFLTLFTRYKKESTNQLKWFTFILWISVSVGMTLFGSKESVSIGQLYILLAPLFIAYGLSLVFMALARMQLQHTFDLARNATVIGMILLSAAPFIAKLPMELYRGIWLGGAPHFPPYYPAALSSTLSEITNEKDIIMSDQPWAVAWYADRRSMWTPLSVSDYRDDIKPIIDKAGVDVQGLLVTPQSYRMAELGVGEGGGLHAIEQKSGDFFPVVVEGVLCSKTPKMNVWFADVFAGSDASNSVASVVSSQGDLWFRYPILGYHMLYYANKEIKRK